MAFSLDIENMNCDIKEFVDAVIDHAVSVQILGALVTGLTAADLLFTKIVLYCLNALFLELSKYHVDEKGCIALFPGTSIECRHFHDFNSWQFE